ncbi:CorA family divalent cation transporter, partial [Cupriavidus sp. OTU4895]
MPSAIVESGYGSDPVGLVSGYLFVPGEPAREIDSHRAIAWLHGDPAGEGAGFLWLHFNLSNSACERWMKSQLGLSEDFFAALRQGSHSTRIERQDDALLAVVNDVIYNFGVSSTDISTLWASVDHRLLVTARS